MLVSFAGTAIAQIILATYMLMNKFTDIDVESYNWVPIVSFSAMIFIAACGAIPVPFVVIAEILPHKVSFKPSVDCRMEIDSKSIVFIYPL